MASVARTYPPTAPPHRRCILRPLHDSQGSCVIALSGLCRACDYRKSRQLACGKRFAVDDGHMHPRSTGSIDERRSSPKSGKSVTMGGQFSRKRRSADEAENHGADKEEGAGYGDVVDEKLSLCAAGPAVANSAEGTIGGTAAEFRIAHTPSSLAVEAGFSGLLRGGHTCPPILRNDLYIIPIRLVGYFFSISPH
jgi:hypothetical protein